MLSLDSFDALTFDCYGTLIDWERGLVAALRALPGERRVDLPDDDTLLETFARFEAEAERGAYRRYREVLEEVAGRVAEGLGFPVGADRIRAFGDSVGSWPPFDDTAEALASLSRRYRLAIVSNVDDDLFERTAERLGVAFDEVVTAEQVRSYKPAPAHFEEMLVRLAIPRERVLHVAQSLYHDIAPAKAMGFSCVWVNRRASRSGGGATPPANATPDMEVPDLASVVRAAGLL